MVNFGPLAAQIVSLVWGTPGNFNGFHILAALLHGTLVVGVSQLHRWTDGATYIQQGGHHVGHWPTFLVRCCLGCNSVLSICSCLSSRAITLVCRTRRVSWTTRRSSKKIIARSCQATGKQSSDSRNGKRNRNSWRRLSCWNVLHEYLNFNCF